MKSDRQEVLAGGVAVLSAVFETLGIDEMRPARGALRVGVLYDLLGRREQHDLRDATVERMLDRFGVDRAQSQRVAATALHLYSELVAVAREEMIKRLGWAALLHEVGFAISHGDYHKHSAYLVQHADMAGFSTSDQEHIAQLVLGQRGNLRKVYTVLEDRERLDKILVLRLAVILNHARRNIELPRLAMKFGRGIELAIDGDWLARHPLTQFLLEEEAAHWTRVGIAYNVKALQPA
jgi:exopolyphosphatase/guanosine-5'-triphosphate,3'-diphosphate pyrophosphatase